MKVNVGGDRLGSGAKMNVELHNYYRSTHNLNKRFQSSLAPGVLYPAYVNIGLNGDKFDIDINEITRTLPTQGPLFGRFKMQIDCFVAPMRLYHGILHNNPINIGLKMNQVKLPKIKLSSYTRKSTEIDQDYQIVPSNLWAYLGARGLGKVNFPSSNTQNWAERTFNAVPLLAYYDIFKNYYANKQEEMAYVIRKKNVSPTISKIWQQIPPGNYTDLGASTNGKWTLQNALNIQVAQNYMILGDGITAEDIGLSFTTSAGQIMRVYTLDELFNGEGNTHAIFRRVRETPGDIQFTFANLDLTKIEIFALDNGKETKIILEPFELENIDKMREQLLQIGLGEEFFVESTGMLPYTLNTRQSSFSKDTQSNMTGLVVKTYQSDLFNNWIKTETIAGTNGIAEITRVDTSSGLDLDALNLAQKVYNMLNRIAVSGGTYEDWQESVYTQSAIRKAETPMYVGGYSSEIMFEEVIATTESGKDQKLGSIGGRGKQLIEKGGHIKFTVEEPSIIMCMVSFTPRISYSQGNKWYLTELDSIDDLHKPALDGIGYQDLLVEQMAFTGTEIAPDGTIENRLSAGKVPAWLNYMTDIDECYGDFAMNEGYSFMVLNRNYEIKEKGKFVTPQDITTYIDPAKFNYAFAVQSIDAQNFWTEIAFNVTARRLMSAKQIPNL